MVKLVELWGKFEEEDKAPFMMRVTHPRLLSILQELSAAEPSEMFGTADKNSPNKVRRIKL